MAWEKLKRGWLFGTLWLVAGVAQAQVFIQDAGPGLYGTPHAFLAVHGVSVWENYRKDSDTFTPPYPPPAGAPVPGTNQWSYANLRQACTGTPCAYKAPGMFFSRVHSLRSPPSGRLAFLGAQTASGTLALDVRVGFLTDGAHGGGAPVSSWIQAQGGEPGPVFDLYFGNLPVDGLHLHLGVWNSQVNWEAGTARANLVAAGSQLREESRVNYGANVTFAGGVTDPGTGGYDLGVPSAMPLSVEWALVSAGTETRLIATLGDKATISWLVDDGATLHGLTQPGNSDGIGYHGGSLDLAALTPAMFLGITGSPQGAPLPDATLGMAMTGEIPVLDAGTTTLLAGDAASVSVTFFDELDHVAAGHTGSLRFSSSDPAAVIPPDFLFTPAAQGSAAFNVRFNTPGHQTLFATDLTTDAGTSVAFDVGPAPKAPPDPPKVVLPLPSKLAVGCGCAQGAGTSVTSSACAALLALLLARERSRWRRQRVRVRRG